MWADPGGGSRLRAGYFRQGLILDAAGVSDQSGELRTDISRHDGVVLAFVALKCLLEGGC